MNKIYSIEDGNPFDWPASFPELKELETVLGCGICFEYMLTAMMTKCSHNFCSLCIRRRLSYKQECPICLEPVLDSDLQNNRIVDEIIQHFTQTRAKLLTLMKSSSSSDQNYLRSDINPNLTSSDQATDESLERTRSNSDLGKSCISTKFPDACLTEKQKIQSNAMKGFFIPSNKNHLKQNSTSLLQGGAIFAIQETDSDTAVYCEPASSVEKCDFGEYCDVELQRSKSCTSDLVVSAEKKCSFSSSPSSVASVNVLEFSSPTTEPFQTKRPIPCTPSTSAALELGSSPPAMVSCPVCKSEVPCRNINLHLDRCLETEQKKERSTRLPVKRKLMPKLVYNLLSEKDLRKKLSEVGLPTNGNRQTLVKRHHELTLMYNSQCDSLNPKSIEEIVSELIQSDSGKSRIVATQGQCMSLMVDKHSTEEEVEMAQKEYMKRHKSQFSELIATARQKRTDDIPSAKPSTISEAEKNPLDFVATDDIHTKPEVSESASLASRTEPSMSGIGNNSEMEILFVEGDPKDSNSEINALQSELSTASTSGITGVRPSRRVRRKLDHSSSASISSDTLDQTSLRDLAKPVSKDLADSDILRSPVVTRRFLRSWSSKEKEEQCLSDNTDEEFEKNNDDYEITSSFKGRKRKIRNSSKGEKPLRSRKPEKNVEGD